MIIDFVNTPSKACKQAGLDSLTELVRISTVSEQTLINWHKNKPQVFKTILAGAVALKASETFPAS